ncbi:MAG: M23 family metallopeptidase [Myxococcales bacterium]|nr:M23 family metallopeptidase [Myxococcales bacterium]
MIARRWMWATMGLAACLLGASRRPLDPVHVPVATAAAASATRGLDDAACPEGTVPDGDVCVHLSAEVDGPLAPAVPNAHRERSGRWNAYEQIPRLPDRPAAYEAYRYPVPKVAGTNPVASGYDLDRPDEAQRRGRRLTHVGHGGVDLPQPRGTPVRLVALEHQLADAEVLYAGPLFGTTVVTRHVLKEGGRDLEYVVLFGHLSSIAPGVAPGRTLKDGDLVGEVGDTGSAGFPHLHLEIRRAREGVDLGRVHAGARLVAEDVSVVMDPRNVLPLD